MNRLAIGLAYGAWLLMFFSDTVSVAAPEARTVRWTEPSVRGTVQCALRIYVRSQAAGTRCALSLTLSQKDLDGLQTTERIDTLSNGLWAETRLAIPIRVKGFPRPQVLVKRYRPNWMDYILYAPIEEEITKVFSFSCRGEDAIKWLSKAGALERFVTFDRFEPAPRSLERQLKGDERWLLRQVWRFDVARQIWRAVSRQWVRYRFGETSKTTIRVISKPADCRFLFPHGS